MHDRRRSRPTFACPPVLALAVGQNRLAVGNLRIVGHHFQLETPLEARLHNVKVQRTHPGDDHLLGLGVARDVEGRVLVGDPGEAGGDLLLVAPGLGLDRQPEQRDQ